MPEKVLLVGVQLKRHRESLALLGDLSAEDSLREFRVLAESAGASISGELIQTRDQADPATLIGSGKLSEVESLLAATQAGAVFFDCELSPTQQRNLERALRVKILDRTQLILDIFAARARTREGQLQVELAQLSYLLPRLAGRGISMSRLGGGIGTRGPGETQLEVDRRKIGRRITGLKRELEKVRAGRGIQRKQRQNVPLATIALVGYTNAGKSTLFNRLTRAGVLADAKMFATLDPTVRHILLPSRRKVLLSDTVGFIRKLPTTLVEAFRATLEEVTEAALLLHVVDASSEEAPAYVEHVGEVLKEIGAESTPQILVLNKADLIPDATDLTARARRILKDPAAEMRVIPVSAASGEGIPALLDAMDEALQLDPVSRVTLQIPAAAGADLHLLHEHGRILSQQLIDETCHIVAEVPESLRRRLRSYELVS